MQTYFEDLWLIRHFSRTETYDLTGNHHLQSITEIEIIPLSGDGKLSSDILFSTIFFFHEQSKKTDFNSAFYHYILHLPFASVSYIFVVKSFWVNGWSFKWRSTVTMIMDISNELLDRETRLFSQKKESSGRNSRESMLS